MNDPTNNHIPINDIKLLLIDDEIDVMEINERTLRKYGYEKIDKATSASEAFELFNNKKHFDVIVADMRMEDPESGFKILMEGENKLSSTIIILTANDSVIDCRKAFKNGAWDYIPKFAEEFHPLEEIHNSIQEAIQFNQEWGNSRDESWISENIDELVNHFSGEYVAVMDKQAIAHDTSREGLIAKLKADNQPTFMPVILKVPEEQFNV